MTDKPVSVGIDLGTTFSAVAFLNGQGVPEIIPNREGERITPSVVLFDGESPIVGTVAKAAALSSPLSTVQFVKRQMGNKGWKYVSEHGRAYTSEEISGIILRRLKEDAETALGAPVCDAVVTVPAYFNDAQRQATSDAGRIAGLNVMRMLNEPTAAALAYGLKQEGLVQTVAVYDLGGGTFDVTVLRVGDGAIEVVATGGDKNLGGFDWDNCLMNYLNDSFKASGGTDLFDDPRFEAELRSKCELAKKTLSTRDKAIVPMSFAGKAITAHVTREDFERITKPLLKRTLNIMDLVLDDANLDWNEINRILLVGGSTRMTAVPHAIEQHTRAKPSRELHPDEVVAFGAAVQAAMCGQHGGTLVPILANLPVRKVVDVNSHSLGVIALNESDQEHNSIILRKNTSIPCAASDVFQTITDNQEQIRIRVTQGEDDDPAYVHIVGEAEITLPKYPKGAPLEVFFSYDVSGLIRVSVKDLTADRMLEQNFSVLVRNENLAPEVVEQKRVDLAKVTVN